jgi:WD40 repeat protein
MKAKLAIVISGLVLVALAGAGNQENATNVNAKAAPQFSGSPKSREGATLKGHQGTILGLAFSPDGTSLAAGSYDGAVSLWNVTAGQGTWLAGHPKGVICVAFSPNGKLLASGGWDKSVKIWDVPTKKQVASLNDLPDIVTAVAFSANSKLLAMGTSDANNDSKTMVKIWDISEKQERATFKGNKGRINFLAFSVGGQTLASGSGNLFLWDVNEGKKKMSHNMLVTCHLGAFWPDGKLLVFTTPSSWSVDQPHTAGVITLMNPETNATIAQFEGHSNRIHGAALSSDRMLLASASKEVKVWDLKEKREVFSVISHRQGATAVALSPEGRTLASGSVDGTIKLWDLSDVLSREKKR